MKKILVFLVSIVMVLNLFSSCKPSGKENKDSLYDEEQYKNLYAINASQNGVNYPETFILMQNRMGIRIEYCVDRGNLQLWICPQAKKSSSFVDRNWSNRDDHTNVFDRILFPRLNLENFVRCDFDPFHSILYFKEQTLHIAQVYDQPAVLIWFEKKGEVDFKVFGESVERSEKAFAVNRTDRGRDFQFSAVMGKGTGTFQQQLVVDPTRSLHARAHLQPNQVLVIAGELKTENILKVAKDIAMLDVNDILQSNETKIASDLSQGTFKLRNHPEMQKVLDLNRRVALSMIDFNGFMRSTNQYIYNLLWWRDGGMNTSHICNTGWTHVVQQHIHTALQNPNISKTEPKGKFFGMLMSGEITKFEEDGLFYVIWPVFNYWTQTGDDTYIKGENLKTLEEAMDWQERYIYNPERGLFGRYFYCETPYSGARDDGWDNANGAPTYPNESLYEGTKVTRAYDAYINLLNYSNYMMLSAMETGAKAEEYYNKALILEKNIRKFFELEGPLPSYGDLIAENGSVIESKPYGMDIWDYVWGLSLPPFYPGWHQDYIDARKGIFSNMTTTDKEFFICTYAGLLASMDPLIYTEDSIMMALEHLMPYVMHTGKFLPMPNTIPELINVKDGDPFHDVRPLVYSIAPWLSTVTQMGVRKQPFGIAVRATRNLDSIQNYHYQKSSIDFSFSGEGNLQSVLVNGKELKKSWQIPENLLPAGDVQIQVIASEVNPQNNVLAGSSLRLISVSEENEKVVYLLEGKVKNTLSFFQLEKAIKIQDENGREVQFTIQKTGNVSWIEFSGRGKFTVSI